MSWYKLLFAFLAALLLPLAIACGDDSTSPSATPATTTPTPALFSCILPPSVNSPDSSAFPVQLVDDKGKSLTLDAPPTSITSLSAGHTEILYAIGAGGQVTAVDKTSNCPAVATALPQVDAFTPSVEAIKNLHPDLVILFYDPGDLVISLRSLDIPVLFLNSPSSVDGALTQIELLGRATGHAAQAANLEQAMQSRIDEVKKAVPTGAKPSVYHEVDNTYFSAGPGSFIADLYKILGAENIADATAQAFPQLSAEAIIAANPDVIILADEDAGESAQTVAARPGWSQINAVKNKRVYVVDPDIISRPGPRLIDALEALAKDLYPGAAP